MPIEWSSMAEQKVGVGLPNPPSVQHRSCNAIQLPSGQQNSLHLFNKKKDALYQTPPQRPQTLEYTYIEMHPPLNGHLFLFFCCFYCWGCCWPWQMDSPCLLYILAAFVTITNGLALEPFFYGSTDSNFQRKFPSFGWLKSHNTPLELIYIQNVPA